MKLCLIAALSALSLASAAYAQAPVVTETVRLNNIDAKSAVAAVKSTQGIDQVTCDFKTNSVSIVGSQDAVDTLKAAIERADIAPAVYRVDLKLVRYQVDAQGKHTEHVEQAPIITTLANVAGSISIVGPQGGFAISVTPGPAADKNAASLAVEVQDLGEQGEVLKSGKNTRSVALGQAVHITGMTDAADKSLRRAAQHGDVVTTSGAYIGYYVEAKATLVSPSGSAKP